MKLSIFILTSFILVLSINYSYETQISQNGNLKANPFQHRRILDTQGRYQLEWLVDWNKDRIYFNVTVATRGYIVFGLNHNSNINRSDLIIGGVYPNGSTYFGDYYCTVDCQIIFDPQQDWELHAASESRTGTFLSFSRAFYTCDPNDMPIDDNVLYLIWAYGKMDNDMPNYPFENQGSQLAYLRDPDFTPRSVHEAMYRSNKTNTEYVSAKVNGAEIWTIREEFTIPAKRTTYWCTIKTFKPPKPGKKHMIGFNIWINPEAIANMHHMLFYRCIPPYGVNPKDLYENFLDQRGQECYMLEDPIGPIPTQFCTKLISGHAIGGKPIFFPENFGIPLGHTNAEDYYLLQVHYDNTEGLAGVKRSVIQMDMYYTEILRKNDGAMLSLAHHIPGSPSILVPPGEKGHSLFGHCSANCTKKMMKPEGIKIIGGILHSHLAGRRIKVQHFRNDVELPWIFNDVKWKFNYQPVRLLRKEVVVLPGDQVTIECSYDTKERNKTTVGGYGTDQEMCKTFLLYYNSMDDYPMCRSEIVCKEYMKKFLAGTTKVTWSNEKLEYIANYPDIVKGRTSSEISDNSSLVTWSNELINQLRKDHMVHDQVEVCPNVKKALNGGQAVEPPPNYVAYPVNVKKYKPEERCRVVN